MWAQGPDGGEVKWSWTDSVSADSCCPQADTVADDQPTDVGSPTDQLDLQKFLKLWFPGPSSRVPVYHSRICIAF